METLVRTPQAIFMMPQRLKVPLFQRPYVWNQERQWEPLWSDVERVASRLLLRPAERQQPHFLGAVVLQQVPTQAGLMMERTIIDGQQRLTTLQLLLDALHAQLAAVSAEAPALRIEPLIVNAAPFRSSPEDQFKVWPTNRDRDAFMAVMAAPPPVQHDQLKLKGERMVEAHRFFSSQAHAWLLAGGETEVQRRASAIETAVRELLQMVVIDLALDENAQEIFETLNDRGAPLTAADLIKNFVFQRLSEAKADVQGIYERHWKDFETGFWEKEISVGRVLLPRSSVFLNHWLIAQTGQEIVAREVFSRFKQFCADASSKMSEIVERIHRSSIVYRDFILQAEKLDGAVDRLGLFGYRTSVLESEVIKPLVLVLLDPDKEPIAPDQLHRALDAVESWMVRRAILRANTKSYNQMVPEMVAELAQARQRCGDVIEGYLRRQESDNRNWPDDDQMRKEIAALPAYRRIGRSRLRMILEAVEDHLRGWTPTEGAIGGERVARGKHSIEHVMPRSWAANWPQALDGFVDEADRDQLLHTLGNLTLLNAPLNSKLSNAPWAGEGGKRHSLEKHDVLFLNRDVLRRADPTWNDAKIRERTADIAEIVLQSWPTPPGHRSTVAARARQSKRVHLSELIDAGLLHSGMSLVPRSPRFADQVATLLSDGRIDVNGKTFDWPSAAAGSLTRRSVNGWYFFLVDTQTRRCLSDVLRDYQDSLEVEIEGVDQDDAAAEGERQCPACDFVFARWPMGWDGHAASTCPGLGPGTPEERKAEYKNRFGGEM